MHASIAWKFNTPGLFSGLLFTAGQRVLCRTGDEGEEYVSALTPNGERVWQFTFKGGEHYFLLKFGEHAYLDGRTIMCLAIDDGRIVAERTFDVVLTGHPPSVLGPTFWKGPLAPLCVIGMVYLWPASRPWSIARADPHSGHIIAASRCNWYFRYLSERGSRLWWA